MEYVHDNRESDKAWHRAPSARDLALCGASPRNGERWGSVTTEIIGKFRACRRCKIIAKELRANDWAFRSGRAK